MSEPPDEPDEARAPIDARLRRHVWNWLPAFLEVAETGSVKRAAERLALTPAAVSRTLRLLQEEFGAPVFDREGRALVLNGRGASLRDAVRRASVHVDSGLREVLGDPFSGALSVTSLGVLTSHLVVPCLIELKAAHPSLVPEHRNVSTRESISALLRAEADVAFYYEDVTTPGVHVERLGSASTSVYCGRGHPLFELPHEPSTAEVLEHPFSIPQIGDSGRVMDGWPSELPRKVGMRITMLQSNLQVSLSGHQLTVLPDLVAREHLVAGRLRRLATIALPSVELFAARNREIPERLAARELVERVRERIAAEAARG